MAKTRKILVICPFPVGVAAGQRLKYEQYFQDWAEDGYDVTVSAFMDLNTWRITYKKGKWIQKLGGILRGHIRRVRDSFSLSHYDCVYIFMWVTPFGSSFFERLYLILSRKVIFDLEDFVVHKHVIARKDMINPISHILKNSNKQLFLQPVLSILLTGGTGFIGSHFLKQALAAGHTVRAIRRSSSSKPPISIDSQPEWLNRQLDEVKAEELQGCEVLVHLAAHSVQYPFDSLANCLRWNLIAVLALFEQARLAGICRFVVAGSCFEYDRSGERYEAIPTDAPLEPTNSYAASKAAASIALCQWAKEHQLDLEILRVFHVYGDGEAETRFWPSLRRAALAGEDFSMTEGRQICDFISVESVANTFLRRAAEEIIEASNVHIYNLGTGEPRSLVSFAHNWWVTWNAKGRLVVGSIPYRENECMKYSPGHRLLIVS